ncbi:AAA family ATPase [Succinivibrio sp.]|uniref:AAA family ATPase n=1 Tax=Succinivibrio sp. TaxID=2053619 RepID=UPI00386BD3E9
MNDLKEALYSIDPKSLNYEQWVEVGMALHQAGCRCDLWDEWSKNDSRYRPRDCANKWRTFKNNGSVVTEKSVFKMARERGWIPSEYKGHEIGFDDYIEADEPYMPQKKDEAKTTLPDDYSGLTGAQQLKVYLETLFKPDEHVGIVTESFQREDGKWTPANRGDYSRTAGKLIKSLEKYPDDLGATTGDWNQEAGAWIRFNPCDGQGVRDVNATAYRFTLIESDEVSIEAQYKAYVEWNLPIAALVFSGTKSLHAIVKIDAQNENEYAQRVSFLYNFLENHGFSVDTQNKNVMRLSRLPGATRNSNTQKLLATNIGAENWSVWRNSIEEIPEEKLPPITSLAEKFLNPDPLPEPLIEEVLREGHKMIISGPSKAGKSFALMELCVCLAEGGKWLGRFQCKQCKVLYVNLEIDAPSANQRFRKIYETLGYSTDPAKNPNISNIITWNLRGHALPLDKLSKPIINQASMVNGIKAIVIDPIYKVITGDENSAADMSAFCNYFDQIGAQTGACTIYCHHHSKGAQGSKKSIDRASGSGVLTRDPDAILDFSEIDLTQLEGKEIAWGAEIDEDRSAWRVTGSLREFRSFKPLNVWFDYPIHRVDTKGELDACFLEGDARSNLKQFQKSPEQRRADYKEELREAYYELEHENGVSASALAEIMGKSRNTVLKWLRELPKNFKNYDGKWFTLEDYTRYLQDTGALD